MNPQTHEEFELLCALSVNGELSPEEWERLDAHLVGCEQCQEAQKDYKNLASTVLPVVAAEVYTEGPARASDPFSVAAGERRLMARLEERSKTVDIGDRSMRLQWIWPILLMAATVILVSSIAFVQRERFSKTAISNPPAVTLPIPPKPQPVIASKEGPAETETEANLQREITALRQKLQQESVLYSSSEHARSELSQQLTDEKASHSATEASRSELDRKLSTAESEVDSLRAKVDASQSAQAENAARIAALEDRLREHDEAADQKDRILAEDKELLSHDRDIRDLIGAPNLYIAEIRDVSQTGRPQKPFGRVFYTKDKSMIFYGYNLDEQPGLGKSVAFQAWGSGDHEETVNLGVFYQDGAQKRWILKFNDAKTLARLNSVFVTVEPRGGSAKPTGKPMLSTYLHVDPNHP